ncbi:hypothetical protein Taro_036220 [Colocasia esculenta]|uniref:Uncharacterized protein n=1 Tax=Colocasia esculenta TaxID=4460 RepID=A0A843W2H9_COLES|nr:hypothetical protein [Colocasia esculenta]
MWQNVLAKVQYRLFTCDDLFRQFDSTLAGNGSLITSACLPFFWNAGSRSVHLITRLPADDDPELLKAVAQVWPGHSSIPGPTREFDAAAGPRGDVEHSPTWFRLEAMGQRQLAEAESGLATQSKQLESSLGSEDHHAVDGGEGSRSGWRGKRESKNSLRRLRLPFCCATVHGEGCRPGGGVCGGGEGGEQDDVQPAASVHGHGGVFDLSLTHRRMVLCIWKQNISHTVLEIST